MMTAPARTAAPAAVRTAPGHVGAGQSLAEFALVVPVLLLVVGGIIQFGVIFWGQNTLNQVAGDTGRWAATQQDCTDTAAVVTTANEIAASAVLVGYAPGSWTAGNVDATWADGLGNSPPVGPCPPTSNQELAWVTVTISHQVPVFLPWIPGDGALTASARFRVEPVSR